MEEYEIGNFKCPVCGAECESLYFTKDNELVGCEECMTLQDAYIYAVDQWENQLALDGDEVFEAQREANECDI